MISASSVIAHLRRPPTDTAQPRGLSFCTDDRHAQRCRIWVVAAARALRKRTQRVGIKRAGAIGADHDLVSLARSRRRLWGHDPQRRARSSGVALLPLVALLSGCPGCPGSPFPTTFSPLG